MNNTLLKEINYYTNQHKRGELNTNTLLYISLCVLSFVLGFLILNYIKMPEFYFNKKTFDYIVSLLTAIYFTFYIPVAYLFKLYLYSGVILKISSKEDFIEIRTLFVYRKIKKFEIYTGADVYAQNTNFLWFKGCKYLSDEEPIFINDGKNYTIFDIERKKYYLLTLEEN